MDSFMFPAELQRALVPPEERTRSHELFPQALLFGRAGRQSEDGRQDDGRQGETTLFGRAERRQGDGRQGDDHRRQGEQGEQTTVLQSENPNEAGAASSFLPSRSDTSRTGPSELYVNVIRGSNNSRTFSRDFVRNNNSRTVSQEQCVLTARANNAWGGSASSGDLVHQTRGEVVAGRARDVALALRGTGGGGSYNALFIQRTGQVGAATQITRGRVQIGPLLAPRSGGGGNSGFGNQQGEDITAIPISRSREQLHGIGISTTTTSSSRDHLLQVQPPVSVQQIGLERGISPESAGGGIVSDDLESGLHRSSSGTTDDISVVGAAGPLVLPWTASDYWQEPMRLVYLCYATLDAITPFPASLVALVGSIALFLFVLRFVVGGQEVTWLFLQVGRQWMLMVLVNHAHYVLSAGPVWAVVLLASALWTLQVIGYLLFIEGWFLLATEPFDLWTTSLLFLFLVTYSVLFCVKILIYCYPESAVAEFLMTDIRLDGQLAGRERPRPLTSEVLKTLLQGKVADLWTPRTRETEIIGKPCAVCCDDIEPEDTVIRLPCTGGHTFHKECVLEWFKRGNRGCPLCRMDVEEALKLEGSSRNPNVAVAAT